MKDQTESVHVEGLPRSKIASEMTSLQKTAGVDTVHNDEAVQVIANYDGNQDWDLGEEKRLVRKIDMRLIPILLVTFGIQSWDKVLLGFAAIFGLIEDLDLAVGNRYPMAASIFYLGYIAGAYPAILLAQRYPIHQVIFGIVFLWGISVICTPACFNYQSLYAQRFFLGFLEAGVSPTWMIVVGSWYKKTEQPFRMGLWFSAAPLVSMISPLVNYGIGHITGSLSPWKYMYLFAGAMTILWAFVIMFFLDAEPVHAKHLNERERYIAIARVRENNTGVRNTHFKPAQVKELLMSIKFLLAFIIAVMLTAINAVPTVFMPIIIRGLGHSGFNALLLSVPAGAVGFVLTPLFPWLSRKLKKCDMTLIVVCLGCIIIGCCLVWRLPSSAPGGKLAGVYLLSFWPPAWSILMAVNIANTAGYTKRSAVSTGLFIGYCVGNFAGPLTFKTNEAPTYETGWTFLLCGSGIGICSAIAYAVVCLLENKKRDATGIAEGFEHAYEDDLTDKKNPQFRYIY